MRTRVGIVIEDMGSELARRAVDAASTSLADSAVDFAVFSESTPVCPFVKSLVPRFSLSDCWEYSGLLVTTSLKTLEICGGSPRPGRLLHYVWEPDWGSRDYFESLAALAGVGVVARSDSHADILRGAFGVDPVGITYFPDFGYFARLLED